MTWKSISLPVTKTGHWWAIGLSFNVLFVLVFYGDTIAKKTVAHSYCEINYATFVQRLFQPKHWFLILSSIFIGFGLFKFLGYLSSEWPYIDRVKYIVIFIVIVVVSFLLNVNCR